MMQKTFGEKVLNVNGLSEFTDVDLGFMVKKRSLQ